MLGFHRRTRSLIPVKDLAKYDKVSTKEEVDEDEEPYSECEFDGHGTSDVTDKSRSRQLMLVYLVFLAEA